MGLKKIVYILLTIFITSCSGQKQDTPNNEVIYDYSDVTHKMITYENLFSSESNHYFVYIYSLTCGHCKNIKNRIISYALNHDNFYLLEYVSSIPIYETIETTIGSTNYIDVGILGTPSLLEICKHVLVSNIAGENEIIKTLSNL